MVIHGYIRLCEEYIHIYIERVSDIYIYIYIFIHHRYIIHKEFLLIFKGSGGSLVLVLTLLDPGVTKGPCRDILIGFWALEFRV